MLELVRGQLVGSLTRELAFLASNWARRNDVENNSASSVWKDANKSRSINYTLTLCRREHRGICKSRGITEEEATLPVFVLRAKHLLHRLI